MRRLTVECIDGHREEIIIGANDKIPRCPEMKHGTVGTAEQYDAIGKCRKKREVVWDEPGSQGAPGFRIGGLSKRF